MRFSGQEYWSGLPCPPPGDLPDPGIKPGSPALVGGFFTTSAMYSLLFSILLSTDQSFIGVLVVKNLPANAGEVRDVGLIPGSGRSPGGGRGNPLQCSCLENPSGQMSPAGYSPWSHKELETTELLSTAQHTQGLRASQVAQW